MVAFCVWLPSIVWFVFGLFKIFLFIKTTENNSWPVSDSIASSLPLYWSIYSVRSLRWSATIIKCRYKNIRVGINARAISPWAPL